jgi:hypothetical protein
VCNGSFGFAVHRTGNISTLKGFVVGFTATVITGVFTGDVTLATAVITAVITGDVTLATAVITAVITAVLAIAGDVTLATAVITEVVATGIGSLVVG